MVRGSWFKVHGFGSRFEFRVIVPEHSARMKPHPNLEHRATCHSVIRTANLETRNRGPEPGTPEADLELRKPNLELRKPNLELRKPNLELRKPNLELRT